MKLIYTFGKYGRVKYVSHLDLQRFIMRALNRTCLPIAFSQGFNPHPVMSIAGALAMGYESDYEVFEIKIQGNLKKQLALETMRNALPEDLPIFDVRYVEDSHPSMMASVKMAEYLITPMENTEAILKAAESFLTMDEYMGIRKTKSGESEVNVRALCKEMKSEDGALKVRLMLTEKETLKPDLLMESLAKIAGIDVPVYKVKRTCLLGENADGEMKPIAEL